MMSDFVVIDIHPLKRLASTSDIVTLIEFLISNKPDYINGVNHPITGGE